MPGFSTFYAYSTHKQKISRGDRKKVEILNPTPSKIFHKIGATILCTAQSVLIFKFISVFLVQGIWFLNGLKQT